MKRNIKLKILGLVLSTVLMSCVGDDDSTPIVNQQSVASIASSNPNFSILVSALPVTICLSVYFLILIINYALHACLYRLYVSSYPFFILYRQ